MITHILLDMQWTINDPSFAIPHKTDNLFLEGKKYTVIFSGIKLGIVTGISIYDSEQQLIHLHASELMIIKDWYNQNIAVNFLELN